MNPQHPGPEPGVPPIELLPSTEERTFYLMSAPMSSEPFTHRNLPLLNIVENRLEFFPGVEIEEDGHFIFCLVDSPRAPGPGIPAGTGRRKRPEALHPCGTAACRRRRSDRNCPCPGKSCRLKAQEKQELVPQEEAAGSRSWREAGFFPACRRSKSRTTA